jgi:hypothetical protein
MDTMESVTTTAMRLLEASSRASGMSSEKTIQIMALRRKPEPVRQQRPERLDEEKSGDRHERLRQAREVAPEGGPESPTPQGTRTRLMASPSGMLWTAMANTMVSMY